MSAAATVSYTHLDVYKRQAQGLGAHERCQVLAAFLAQERRPGRHFRAVEDGARAARGTLPRLLGRGLAFPAQRVAYPAASRHSGLPFCRWAII